MLPDQFRRLVPCRVIQPLLRLEFQFFHLHANASGFVAFHLAPPAFAVLDAWRPLACCRLSKYIPATRRLHKRAAGRGYDLIYAHVGGCAPM